jgi:pilus assembly protein CpaC
VTTRRVLAFSAAAWGITGLVLSAQAPLPPPPAPPGAAAILLQPGPASFERISLTAGRSHVLTTNFDVTRLAVTNPATADATAVTPREILIDSKGPGITSLILWGANQRVQYDVVVDLGVPPLQAQIQAVFPDEDIRVSSTEESVVLSGSVSSNEVALRAEEIAQASAATAKVINMLQRSSGPDSQQVMLEVRFAEVDHNALMDLGVSLLAHRSNVDVRSSTQQFPSPVIDDSKIPAAIQVPDYLNIFFFLRKEGIMAVLKALQQRGLFKSLAEPNLIAYNGQ